MTVFGSLGTGLMTSFGGSRRLYDERSAMQMLDCKIAKDAEIALKDFGSGELRNAAKRILCSIGYQANDSSCLGSNNRVAMKNAVEIAREYRDPVKVLQIIDSGYALAVENRIDGGFSESVGDLVWLGIGVRRFVRDHGVQPDYVELSRMLTERQESYVSPDLRKDSDVSIKLCVGGIPNVRGTENFWTDNQNDDLMKVYER